MVLQRGAWAWVPREIARTLDPALGSTLEPIRSEVFGRDRFEQHARSLAATHRAGKAPFRQATFYPRLQDNIRSLKASYGRIAAHTDDHDPGPAAAWLLDNFHLIEGQLQEIRHGLPGRYYRSLPVLQEPPLVGLPRIYGVAWAFVAHTDSAFDEALLHHILEAYQDVRELSLGELWALPTTLRVVLVENLRRLADRVVSHKAARDLASLCAQRIASFTPALADELLVVMEQRGVDGVFLAQLAQSLLAARPSANSTNLADMQVWLQTNVPDFVALQMQLHASQAADQMSLGNAVTALRLIGTADWAATVARCSRSTQVMLGSAVFEAEDDATRTTTLHSIERLASLSGQSESAVAQALLQAMTTGTDHERLSAHWLSGSGSTALRQSIGLKPGVVGRWRPSGVAIATVLYLGVVLCGSVALVAWLLGHSGDVAPRGLPLTLLAAALMWWPACEMVVALVNRLVSESVKPVHLPRLLLADGIPPAAQVMVVVPALLTRPASIAALVHRLHLHHLANPEACAQFALLSDWGDAPAANMPDDDALLAHARVALEALNLEHPVPEGQPARFLLLHRARSWCETQGQWLGWERKRGKLEQLVAALATGDASPFFDLGALSQLAPHTRYVLTLDSDTRLPPGCLRTLVGVAEHPQHRPELSNDGRRVVRGYGIFQPRLVAPLPDAGQLSGWQWLGGGQRGLDPYSAMTSDVYQDLFHEGSFTGKGLLHVDTLHAVLGQRLPPERVLSHDLIEGALVRCAVVTDVTLIEAEPEHADAAASRLHRWIRGDWQLWPFLIAPRVWPLGAINRWKLADNLRRSLVAPASLALVVLSMAHEALSLPVALLLAAAAQAAGPLMGAVAGGMPRHWHYVGQRFIVSTVRDLLRTLVGALWYLMLLPRQALNALDATARTLHRLAVSQRHLLEWTTAEAAQAGLGTGLRATLQRHRVEPLTALVVLLGVWWLQPQTDALTLTVITAWAAAPLCVWLMHLHWPTRARRALRPADHALLSGVARDTWRLFERCVDAHNHHLPPDNLQTAPIDAVAHRTSPTNMGLYLLSAMCARRFGWIGTEGLLARLDATLGTLHQMERHRGHFLNWYDTTTLQPLHPRYVSTVDSGNFSVHLLAVAQACLELADEPHAPQPADTAIATSLARLEPWLGRFESLLHRPLHTMALAQLWPEHATEPGSPPTLALLHQMGLELEALALPRHASVSTLQHAGAHDQLLWLLRDHLATHHQATLDRVAHGTGQGASASERLRAAARDMQALAWSADFRFLYHPRRHLLHIGFNVDAQRLDTSMYDLLASESRSTSLLAIAKGDAPPRHWAALGRPFFASRWHAALSSWSGSMFEYLMPTLLADEPQGSALREAGASALREQRYFVRDQRMPWGMSESAYAGRDHTLAYQYAPQGVPRLALRRTPEAERVIAPYATALAASIDPRMACDNLRALEALGARGHYGMVEAVDFTAARQVDGSVYQLVHTFMAHHQGMTIASLTNVLHGGLVQRWGMADPRMEAVAGLLHEQAPRQLQRLPASRRKGPAAVLREPNPVRVLTPGAQALEPTHLLSNGRYSVTLRPNGAGWSRWGQTNISRWRDDALRDAHGSFLYVRTDRTGPPSSITSHPAPDPAAVYQSRFHSDRVCFDAEWPGLNAHTTVWVSPEDDIELRKVELVNQGSETIELELISALDITLASAAADESHPVFSNLFVKADWLPDKQALRFERTPRLASEAGPHAALFAAHFVASAEGDVQGLRCQTDRLHWLGRNHTASQPLATLHQVPTHATALDTGLDPVAAVGVTVRLAPGAQACITFATAASDSAATLLAVIDKYREPSHVERASAMSATLAGIPSGSLRPRGDYLPALHAMTTALVLTLPRVDPPLADTPPTTNRRALWPLGISGDRPIVLVRAGVAQGLGLLRLLAILQREWSRAGVACDVIVLSRETHSYDMPLQRELLLLQEQHANEQGRRAGTPMTGLHLLRADALSTEQLDTLDGLARVTLEADGQPLLHQVRDWCARHERSEEEAERARAAIPLPPHLGTTAASPVRGAFVREGAGFAFHADHERRPPKPWINVLANPGFGALVSEGGGGYTWALNSRMHQLTAWSNDPVADPPGEWFWLEDRRTREAWSLFPSAWGSANSDYRVEHGQGHTTIQHRHGAVAVSIRWCVDVESAIKQVRIVLTNEGQRKEHLRLTGMVEWVMGERRADRATLLTSHAFVDPLAEQMLGLLCTQTEVGSGFGGSTAFFCEGDTEIAHHSEGLDWGCDRRGFFDPEGRPVLPRHLGQRSGPGLDPCAAFSRTLTLRPGATLEQVYLIGHAANADAARHLMQHAIAVPAEARELAAQARWSKLLGATRVSTPDPLLDALTNHWLLYQTVSSRLWAKAAFYQAGGATGFRDQLQDAMALAWAEPGWLRAQLLLCASRQFKVGDVQHWWHMPGGAGVRTHMSDDLLWLPFACSHYLHATGDAAVLDERVPFLDAPPVPEGAEDVYSSPAVSVLTAPVYEHAARSIDHSLRTGVHGLPLMGGGDWNDGMNRVGHEGKGESVWLAWFLCAIVPEWIALAQQRGDAARARRWEKSLAGWRAALEGPAWDGAWFRRAFFDDGSVLGSSTQSEARIDLIAQAWSVMSGEATPERQAAAMHAVETELVDHDAGLLRLLTPPLAHAQPSAGYIQAYPGGVRENGGQYSHAGVWALMASAILAQRAAPDAKDAYDTPYRYFTYLSPAHRAAHPKRGAAYGLEPYAMAADVYSESPYVGRGGWSWYTGAAGWLHRAVVESIFGLHQEAEEIFLTPCLPSHWPRAEITLTRGDMQLRFTLLRASATGAQAAHPKARCLAVGERLRWRGLPPESHFVIPLLLNDGTPENSSPANAMYGTVHTSVK